MWYNMLKTSLLLRNLRISCASNCFYMNKNIWGDVQIFFSNLLPFASLVVTCCHSVSLVVSLVVISCTSRCHSLSLVILRCHSLCHSLSFVVTCYSMYHSSLFLTFFIKRQTSGTSSDNKWQRVATNENEW